MNGADHGDKQAARRGLVAPERASNAKLIGPDRYSLSAHLGNLAMIPLDALVSVIAAVVHFVAGPGASQRNSERRQASAALCLGFGHKK
jgi:hypothetical protein